MTEQTVVDSLTVFTAYQCITDTPLLEKSNPLLIPNGIRITDKGGVGPFKRLLIFGDSKRVEVHTSSTDSENGVRACVHASLPAFEIVTKSRGNSDSPKPNIDETKLSFDGYSCSLAVLKDLVSVQGITVEWAACWLLQNSDKICVYDSYVKCGKLTNTRLKTPAQVLIALEAHNIGAYLPNSNPSVVNINTDEKQFKEVIPVPLLFIRKSSRKDSNGYPIYNACSGEQTCEQAVRLCHFHMKSDVKMRVLDASNIARLVIKMLDTHIFMPIPYLAISDANNSHKLFAD